MAKIRVLVIEDSLTMRKYLVKALGEDPQIEVVGEAENGNRGVEDCYRLRPDVITLDMMMPGMTGLDATEQIMAYRPTPILIVSSSVNQSELFKTYDALAAGAVDVIEKPEGNKTEDAWHEKFISAVKRVSRIKVITHLKGRLGSSHKAMISDPSYSSVSRSPRNTSENFACVVIGVSTGGPKALVEVFSHLPADFPLPIFVVIHIGHPFGAAFAEWLDSLSPIRVTYAVDGVLLSSIERSKIILAPPDRHLTLNHDRIHITDDPERHSCRPSVDVFFDSVARALGSRVIACLLTGMGRDGAEGLLAIRKAGGSTIAQDEATSVIFGMPREAILIGAAQKILPLHEIAPTLLGMVGYLERQGGNL